MWNSKESLLFCLIGPGASGKSSIAGGLLKTCLPLKVSISTTTRTPRPYEKDGREYNFVSKEEFQTRIKNGNFVEYAEFAGYMYGTEKCNFEGNKESIVLDIEIQGVKQLKTLFQDRVIVIFVSPPSREVLLERFRSRGSDSDARIEERMKIAEAEMAEAKKPGFSDYIIVNESLEVSIDLARSIVQAEFCKRVRLVEGGGLSW